MPVFVAYWLLFGASICDLVAFWLGIYYGLAGVGLVAVLFYPLVLVCTIGFLDGCQISFQLFCHQVLA